MLRILLRGAVATGVVALLGCGQVAFEAIDQASPHRTGAKVVEAIDVPEGFRAVLVVAGLNYPSSIAWDEAGRMYILESHTVPIPGLKPRILRVGEDGHFDEVPLTGASAPTGESAVGLTFHERWLYFSHEEKDGSFGISRVSPDGGDVEAVLRGLPAQGDHDVNYLVFDRGGTLYFGLGSATNSGVVSSSDPVNGKWLSKHPEARDIPCEDLVLAGAVFTEDNALTEARTDRASTGAFQPYGHSGARQVAGEALCTGAMYRLPPGGRTAELVAWGFRNPVALAVAEDGEILVGAHGADVRSTRPVLDDPDAIYRLRRGAWYGWPDYSAELLPITEKRYRAPFLYFPEDKDKLEFVINHALSGLPAPDKSLLLAITEPHAALGGMAIVPRAGPFARWAGHLLVSEMGDFKPTTDAVKPDERAGFQIEEIDLENGRRKVFARNRGRGDSLPASRLDLKDGFERPVDVKFGPDRRLYVLDFGVFQPTAKSAKVFPKTGKVFRIEPAPRPR